MNSALRWTLLITAIFVVILIPFMLFGDQIESWTEQFLETAEQYSLVVVLVLGGLLATDILIPTPSSLISTAAGLLLGFVGGMLTSLIGMTISCVLGYWLGAKFGRPLAARLVSERELDQLERLSERFGQWIIVVCRPVPMLAEGSVLLAGIGHMSFPQFMAYSFFSNLGVSAVYALVGSLSASVNTFLLAFFGAILVPGIIMLVAGRFLTPPQAEADPQPSGS
jgi:uncharacterized membrane protein YdjX (TVP38/TMEM64 family)